jgi:hypothetical protein
MRVIMSVALLAAVLAIGGGVVGPPVALADQGEACGSAANPRGLWNARTHVNDNGLLNGLQNALIVNGCITPP